MKGIRRTSALHLFAIFVRGSLSHAAKIPFLLDWRLANASAATNKSILPLYFFFPSSACQRCRLSFRTIKKARTAIFSGIGSCGQVMVCHV